MALLLLLLLLAAVPLPALGWDPDTLTRCAGWPGGVGGLVQGTLPARMVLEDARRGAAPPDGPPPAWVRTGLDSLSLRLGFELLGCTPEDGAAAYRLTVVGDPRCSSASGLASPGRGAGLADVCEPHGCSRGLLAALALEFLLPPAGAAAVDRASLRAVARAAPAAGPAAAHATAAALACGTTAPEALVAAYASTMASWADMLAMDRSRWVGG
jgi:hypothetical protein